MDWLESILYGLIAGVSEILPVSSQAHRTLMINLYGETTEPPLLRLLIHLGILAGLYFGCSSHITRMTRAIRLAKVPKRRRKRPLDVRSLRDWKILQTMAIPVILSFFLYRRTDVLTGKLVYVSVFLLLNCLILQIPRYLPSGNKTSEHMSRLEGLLLGLGSALGTLPGVSAIGGTYSVGTACGLDKSCALDFALLADMPLTAGFAIFDLVALISQGTGGAGFVTVLGYLLAALCAFGGVYLGLWILRQLVKNHSLDVFSLYCLGAALFSFILFLNI